MKGWREERSEKDRRWKRRELKTDGENTIDEMWENHEKRKGSIFEKAKKTAEREKQSVRQ